MALSESHASNTRVTSARSSALTPEEHCLLLPLLPPEVYRNHTTRVLSCCVAATGSHELGACNGQ